MVAVEKTISLPDDILKDLQGLDPDTSSQSVVAIGVDYPSRQLMSSHNHQRGQLIFVVSGSMRVETDGGIWITTPGRACWIPGGVTHKVIYTKASKARAAYIREDYLERLPNKCCVLQLSALLRELVIAAVDLGRSYDENGQAGRLIQVLIDQIGGQMETPVFLPEGKDHRLRRLTALLYENPGDSRSLDEWCQLVGASARTLTRLFLNETGMTFSAWRQQLCLIRALEMMEEGQSVTQIAFALGYGSTSSFSTMFTRAMGEPPTAYTGRHEHSI
jgi:AraC-like DNA-binding protein/quercetin dioxygenase-like cupin family protein